MKKSINWIWDNILFLETLFLIIFIPLYPKIPLIDIKNTWVYIRAEDFIIFFVFISWIILLIKEKITLKTPLTVPILIFWIVGVIATLHGVLIVFPDLANVFPNVAFLSLVRHIEYISVFFIAFAGIKNKNQLKFVIAALVVTLLGVIFYGFGQKYLHFPAFLTMNEEFAKGAPIQLSALSRVPSTFAGHYDLAAYLVLIIPMMISLYFGFKNWFIKIGLLFTSFLGFILLFMTVSRVSFIVLFIALLVVFFFQKKKLVLLSVPLGILFVVFLLLFQSSLINRFKSTVSQIDVVVDAQTGGSLGHVEFKDKDYFKDKVVLQRRVKDSSELGAALEELKQNSSYYSSSSAILPFKFVPASVPLVTAVNISNGESLSQGTGYVNLYLSPVVKKIDSFYYELPPDLKGSSSAQFLVLRGNFIVKRASAYDLSFTTRFQGEWPNTIKAFKRNILLGSGYGAVSLAVDNNYLRILGEIGLLGFTAFFLIFLTLGIYIKKIFPDIDSKLAKSFIIGFGAGTIGLALNATLIDVFEASKVAYIFWILMGVTFGVLLLYQKNQFNLWHEIRKAATSVYAIILYLFIACFVLFSPTLNNYFAADDFTWLRWAADCGSCNLNTFIHYFTTADGFFYRPGTKILFYFLYHSVWLNQVVYHSVSMILHFVVAALVYLLARKIFKSNLLGALSGFLFVFLSGGSEAILWISAYGNLIATAFGLLGLLFYVYWEEKKKIYFYIGTFISFSLALLFQEVAIVFPLLIPAYQLLSNDPLDSIKKTLKRWDFLLLFVPVIIYIIARTVSGSHWSGGDYSYNLILLPFNLVGNLFGYSMLTIIGQMSLPIYTAIRNLLREHLLMAIILIPFVVMAFYAAYRFVYKSLKTDEKRIVNFGLAIFVILLLPVIGLGNIASRYDYVASVGLILLFVLALKKIYEYLLVSGREIAIGSLGLIIGVFLIFQIIQVQQNNADWAGAGTRIKNFFVAIDSYYDYNWGGPTMEFHLVNVPVKVGNAWVFPVGINDALWFAFKNNDAKVILNNSKEEALGQAGLYRSRPVFIFNEDGSVTQVDRFKYVPLNLIMP